MVAELRRDFDSADERIGRIDVRPAGSPPPGYDRRMFATRIIIGECHGQWYASFDDESNRAYGGDDAATALRRLLLASPHRPVDVDRLIRDAESRPGRIVFVIPAATCQECGGSGRYVGLQAVEACRRCGGSGAR